MGIDPAHYRTYSLLRLGIGPAEALAMPALTLDWLLAIDYEVRRPRDG